MEKAYTTPEIEIMVFYQNDIITVSGIDDITGDNFDPITGIELED